MSDRTLVVGATRRDWLPAKVLERSALARAASPVRVLHTFDREWPWPPPRRDRNVTGFSLVRLAVPELCGFSGRAVYMDSDMVVLADVAELFALPFGAAAVLRPPNQAAVVVYDCARLRHWTAAAAAANVGSGRWDYACAIELAHDAAVARSVPARWNRCDERPADTALVHFTTLARQPWREGAWHPLAPLWFAELRAAVRDGTVSADDVRREHRAGHVSARTAREALP